MSMNKKAKKNLIIAAVTTVLVAGFALGLWFFVQYQSDQKTVEVLPVSNPSISTTYWGDQIYTSGRAANDATQEIYPSNEQTVSEIYVQEGQQVSIGDPLIQYDKTLLELDVEAKDLAVKQADIELDDAEKQLKKLQNTKPITTPKPTPTPAPTKRPLPTPTPTPTPTPVPSPTVPPASATLYSRLDADSKPYSGSGTTEDPYVFLCTEDCVMTKEFLLRLLGDGSGATPSPDDVLASPFAAIFEVREGDSNYGDLLHSFLLDGTALSGGFQISNIISSEETLESLEETFTATTKATPTPTPNPNNYNDMGYTKEELKKLIQEKRQEIKELQLKVKQAKLDLEKSKLKLDGSTVRSTIDGVIRTLTDEETATQNSQPFLVVSGQGQYTIQGTLSESLLSSVHVGDVVSAMSHDTGMTYSATILEISQYPLDGNYGGYGNPNDSNYEFTAALDSAEDITDGMYMEITLNVNQNSDDAIYLYAPYIREDEGGKYVMKAGVDNRLYKQYMKLGKSIYGGEYFEVLSGVTYDDYIAFPYGNDVKEGVRVVLEGTEEPPVPDGTESSPDAETDASSADNAAVEEMDGATATIHF